MGTGCGPVETGPYGHGAVRGGYPACAGWVRAGECVTLPFPILTLISDSKMSICQSHIALLIFWITAFAPVVRAQPVDYPALGLKFEILDGWVG